MLALMGLVLQLAVSTPYWPDSSYLVRRADSAGVNSALVLAIAWQESRGNLDPKLRGHHCWHGAYILEDGTIVGPVHLPDCEWGRFQVKPSTASKRCVGLNIKVYRDNVSCALKLLADDSKQYGELEAARRFNGAGNRAVEYRDRVLKLVGYLTLKGKR